MKKKPKENLNKTDRNKVCLGSLSINMAVGALPSCAS